MTDASAPTPMNPGAKKGKHAGSLYVEDARTKKRNAAEKRFQAYGIAAIGVGIFFLVILLVSIVRSGIPAFTQTFIEVPVYLDAAKLDKNGNRDPDDLRKVSTFGYAPLIDTAVLTAVQEQGIATEYENAKDMRALVSASAPVLSRGNVMTILADCQWRR